MKKGTTFKQGNLSKVHTVISSPKVPKQFNNLTGKRYGKLLILKHLGVNYLGHQIWECKCDCGTICNASANTIISKRKSSCGCLNTEKFLIDVEVSGVNHVYSVYKTTNSQNNREFSLTRDEFGFLLKQNCYYCNGGLSNQYKLVQNRVFYYNGIDRIDSKKGYTKDNCVTCCAKCNYAKSDYSVDEFKTWVKLIYNNLFKK